METRTPGHERQPMRFIRSEWTGQEPVKLDFFPFEKYGPDYFTRLDSDEDKSRELTEEDCKNFVPKRGGVKVVGNNWMGFWYVGPSAFLPGESHGQRSLASCSPEVCKQLDATE